MSVEEGEAKRTGFVVFFLGTSASSLFAKSFCFPKAIYLRNSISDNFYINYPLKLDFIDAGRDCTEQLSIKHVFIGYLLCTSSYHGNLGCTGESKRQSCAYVA
jgi:hypothetical protein